MSLCHMDGSIHKTPKSAMVTFMEKEIDMPDTPSRFDIVVVDGFHIIHTMKNIPRTF